MASGVYLALYKNKKGYDITDLVQKVVWKGRKGSASRSINVTLIDDNGADHDRAKIKVMAGHTCIFKYNGKELFRGLIMSTTQDSKKQETFIAYDIGIYLANNRDTFVFKKKTADAIFKSVCNRFKIPYTKVAKCNHVIKELTKSKSTAFDVICDAMNQEYESTGIRHYVACEKGKLKLLTRRENFVQWVIEEGANIESYSYTKSIEDVRTRVKIVSDKGKVVASTKNTALEKKIGIFQEVQSPDDSMSKAQIKKLVKSVSKELGTPERTLTIDALGIPSVISGRGVYIIIKALGLKKTFYVDQDTHTFEGNSHTMNLVLTYVNDLTK
jgi:hypothetical protein